MPEYTLFPQGLCYRRVYGAWYAPDEYFMLICKVFTIFIGFLMVGMAVETLYIFFIGVFHMNQQSSVTRMGPHLG